MELIRCDNLTVRYGAKELFSGLTFSVEAGDYLCVVGENGSGKTTLLRTLLGMKDPAEGSVTFSGGLKKTELGYLPQQTEIQKDFPASVWEIVLSGCQSSRGSRPFYSREEKRRAEANIEKLGIDELKGHRYSELSGGQQQRVLLARALCAASKLLVLDEPVTGLDPSAAEEMYETVKSLNDAGMTIIMISHDMVAAEKYADHILRIGDECYCGSADRYFESAAGSCGIGGVIS